MPTIAVASPLAPGVPVALHYRDHGSGPPLVFLHGGWGYGYYPLPPLPGLRVVIPDRTGYGASPRVDRFPPDFHAAAAREVVGFLDALGLAPACVWGHSDGAVIAARLALDHPERVSALILEALHLDRGKPGSRAFFTMMAEDPDGFGERVTSRLAADHGPTWRTPIRADGRVWLDLAAAPAGDLFDHRLATLAVPTLALHGGADPRSEPGELDRLRRDVPHAELHVFPGGGHAPHSERASAAEVARLVTRFVTAHGRHTGQQRS